MDSDPDVPVTIADLDEAPLLRGDRFGRFTALAAPVEARGKRSVLVSSTQVDSVVPTVPDSSDAVQVNNVGEAEVVGESDTESNRTVPVTNRKEDLVDGGSEVEPPDSIAGFVDEESEAFARPLPPLGVTQAASKELDEVWGRCLLREPV